MLKVSISLKNFQFEYDKKVILHNYDTIPYDFRYIKENTH